MVKGEGLPPATTASIAVAALVLGKSVLLANALPFINRFPEKPLMWNVCWKSLIYFFVALLIHYLEHLYDFWKEAPGLPLRTQSCFRKSCGRTSGRSRSCSRC